MKITLLTIGKNHEKYLIEGLKIYSQRINRYIKFSEHMIADIKQSRNKPISRIREEESVQVMAYLNSADFMVLLDEKGLHMNSRKFSFVLNKWMVSEIQSVVIVVGGAFGVSEVLKKRANMILSLSSMTFSHQMVRLFFLEQLYRAFTILRNEPYHND